MQDFDKTTRFTGIDGLMLNRASIPMTNYAYTLQ